jgi:hypothetical protein
LGYQYTNVGGGLFAEYVEHVDCMKIAKGMIAMGRRLNIGNINFFDFTGLAMGKIHGIDDDDLGRLFLEEQYIKKKVMDRRASIKTFGIFWQHIEGLEPSNYFRAETIIADTRAPTPEDESFFFAN